MVQILSGIAALERIRYMLKARDQDMALDYIGKWFQSKNCLVMKFTTQYDLY